MLTKIKSKHFEPKIREIIGKQIPEIPNLENREDDLKFQKKIIQSKKPNSLENKDFSQIIFIEEETDSNPKNDGSQDLGQMSDSEVEQSRKDINSTNDDLIIPESDESNKTVSSIKELLNESIKEKMMEYSPPSSPILFSSQNLETLENTNEPHFNFEVGPIQSINKEHPVYLANKLNTTDCLTSLCFSNYKRFVIHAKNEIIAYSFLKEWEPIKTFVEAQKGIFTFDNNLIIVQEKKMNFYDINYNLISSHDITNVIQIIPIKYTLVVLTKKNLIKMKYDSKWKNYKEIFITSNIDIQSIYINQELNDQNLIILYQKRIELWCLDSNKVFSINLGCLSNLSHINILKYEDDGFYAVALLHDKKSAFLHFPFHSEITLRHIYKKENNILDNISTIFIISQHLIVCTDEGKVFIFNYRYATLTSILLDLDGCPISSVACHQKYPIMAISEINGTICFYSQ